MFSGAVAKAASAALTCCAAWRFAARDYRPELWWRIHHRHRRLVPWNAWYRPGSAGGIIDGLWLVDFGVVVGSAECGGAEVRVKSYTVGC